MLGGNMKRFFQLTLGIFVILCFQHSALGADATKIAVVDIQQLQRKSRTFQKERALLKKKFDAMREKLKACGMAASWVP